MISDRQANSFPVRGASNLNTWELRSVCQNDEDHNNSVHI
jgi:hypothetical protein